MLKHFNVRTDEFNVYMQERGYHFFYLFSVYYLLLLLLLFHFLFSFFFFKENIHYLFSF